LENSTAVTSPEPKIGWRTRGANLVCAIAILVFVCLAWIQAGKPLQLDNMDFPAMAAATAESGVPIYYRGEENPRDVGLYHPPLYIYTLAGWFELFGASPTSARLFDVLCAVVAGFLALRIVREVFGAGAARGVAPAFFIVYLLNPFALQAFAIADIDTSIYPPLILLAIWASLRVVFAKGELRTTDLGWRDFALIVLMFFLCFWAKLTTTLSLPLVFGPVLSIRLGVWRSVAVVVGISTATAILFVATYWIYGDLTGLDTDYTWRFLIQSATSKSAAGGESVSLLRALAGRLIDNAAGFVRWGLSLAAVCAFAAEIQLVLNVSKTAGVERARWTAALMILTYAIFVVGVYSLITSPFAGAPFKYIAPVWALIALSAAWTLYRLCSSLVVSDRALAAGFAVVVVGLVVGSIYLRDAALFGNDVRFFRGLGMLLAAALVATLWAYLRSPDRSTVSAVRLLALAAAVALAAQGLGAAAFQARADYATQYDYGQAGFDQTRDWLRQNTAPDEIIMSMKDLGSAAGRRYLENYQFIHDEPHYNLELLESKVRELGIHVFVFTERRGMDELAAESDLSRWIDGNTTRIVQFGNYDVYRKN